MKNLTITLLTFLIVQFHLSGQGDGQHGDANQEFHNALIALENRLVALENENKVYKQELRSRDSLAWSSSRVKMLFAIQGADVLEKSAGNVFFNMSKDDDFVALMELNNPTSDALGFKFVDVVTKASQNAFVRNLTNGREQDRWKNIVSKLTQNEILKSIMQSNPITSLVSSIVSAATNFSVTTLDKKEKAAQTIDAFKQEQIKEFNDEIQPYIIFYDSLTAIGKTYQDDIHRLDAKYSHLKGTATAYQSLLVEKLQLTNSEESPHSDQVNTIYTSVIVAGRVDYRQVLEINKIKKASEFIKDFDKLKADVEALNKEYADALTNFLNSYNGLLVRAKKTLKKGMDSEKIDEQIQRIQKLKMKVEDQTKKRE